MGGRAGGGARGGAGGAGLSAYDRDNLAMFKKLGHPRAEIAQLANDIRKDNAKNASTVSGIKLTKTGKGSYNLSWNDSSTSNGQGGSISFSASPQKAAAAAKTLKMTGSGRKTLFTLNN